MKRTFILLALVLLTAGCTKKTVAPGAAVTTGAALVEVSGSKQAGRLGAPLDQPIVVQVNDQQGTAVPGARVTLAGPSGVRFDPASGLTDSSGQFSAMAMAPGTSGHFQLTAETRNREGKAITLALDEIALGYEQVLGQQLSAKYCARCHDPESTPERVSNMDNLDPKPHAFTEGDTLNKINDADLALIISRGGPALNKSASMPPYGYTVSKADIQAIISYIRAVSDPPYRTSGVVYANK